MTEGLELIEAALYELTAAGTGISAVLGSNPARIFDTQADAEITKGDLDYAVYQLIAGGEQNDTPGEWADARFLWKYCSRSQTAARTGIGLLKAALQDKALTMVGWTSWRLECGAWYSDVAEMPPGRQWYMKGFYLHVSADNDS